MYNSKGDMLESKIERLYKKLKEEKLWAEEGLKKDNLDESSIGFYKGVKYLVEVLEEV